MPDEKDQRTYIRVHDGMPDHPKIVGLSAASKWGIVAMWCYCSRNLTDGRVPGPIAAREGKRVLTELAAAGLIEASGSDWVCRDYTKHQRTADEVAEMREKRRFAGSLGGKAKAKGLASAKQVLEQTPSKSVAYTETDTEELETSSSSLKPQARGTKLPDDFKPTTEMVSWARAEGLADDFTKSQHAKFIDYWIAQPGAKGRKADWPATWRNWMRNAAERQPARTAPTTGAASQKAMDWLSIGQTPMPAIGD